jgi:nonsense-mediated mRNA decay protein 3
MELDEIDRIVPQVQCCVCGIVIPSNPSNMCPNCIRAHVDITGEIQKEYIIVYCPECNRYHQPPKFWGRADFESRELLTLCLKKIKGLAKFSLIDASFIWTEPHSKRLKVKITLQKEIFSNTVIQQTAQIEYEVLWQQCPTCQKVATGQPQWDAVVQLRQKVEHKRTFLYLEQIVLKHRMHEDVTRIESHPDGLDFFYGHKSHAMSFVDFVSAQAPTTRRDACQLVSHDSKSNTAVQHHTFSLELAPLCREDLVVLPPQLHTKLGGLGPLVLVFKVYSSIVFLDPRTLRAGEITSTFYWKHSFDVLASSRRMVEFYVIDISLTGVANGKFQQAIATVCLSSEVGQSREWIVQTHLGNILNPGDLAKGYFMESLNVNNDDLEKYRPDQIQDVILVRKHFPAQQSRRHLRQWKLKKLDTVEAASLRPQNREQQETEWREFEDEVERDKELRKDIPVYKDIVKKPSRPLAQTDEAADDDDEEAPVVELSEMLDELRVDDEQDGSRPKRERE